MSDDPRIEAVAQQIAQYIDDDDNVPAPPSAIIRWATELLADVDAADAGAGWVRLQLNKEAIEAVAEALRVFDTGATGATLSYRSYVLRARAVVAALRDRAGQQTGENG